MIEQTKTWMWAFTKRMLYQKRMFLLFLLFPLLCTGIRIYCQGHESLLQVALYQEGTSSLASETIQQLMESEGIVSFYEADSTETLYREVENTSAECGYIFTDKYQEASMLDPQLWKHSVEVVQSPGSSLTGSINELVFSVFFQHYNKKLLQDYLSRDNILKKGEDVQAMLADADSLFDIHCNDGSTFSFAESHSNAPSDASRLQEEASQLVDVFLTNAGRGILSVMLLLCALCGGIFLGKDQKTLLVMPLRPSVRILLQFIDIATPVLMMAASGLIGILILPAHQPIWTELVALILYSMLLTLFVLLVEQLAKSELVFCILIPLLTLCSLILSPVFVDLSAYISLLSIPKYLLPGSYYLEAVSLGGMALLRLSGVILITAMAAFAAMRIQKKRL